MDIDFKELSSDPDIVSRLTQFTKAVDQIQEVLKFAEDPELYEQLSNEEKIKFNHLMSFSLNSLFWMYMRAEGIDPTKHQIKSENERLKQSMIRAKQMFDTNTERGPRLNVDAANRFIKHSLWVPVEKENESNDNSRQESEENWDR